MSALAGADLAAAARQQLLAARSAQIWCLGQQKTFQCQPMGFERLELK